MSEQDKEKLIGALTTNMERLTTAQLELVGGVVSRLSTGTTSWRAPDSDFVSASALNHIGDALLAHHSMSQAPLSKDRFEHALEGALRKAGHDANLARRGNPGHDITVDGVPVSLKTQADSGIKAASLHISKFMELGKGDWNLPELRDRFLHHMRNYERIFQFRCFRQGETGYLYELVEIPKKLLEEAKGAILEIREDSRQTPKPGYGHVYDSLGQLKFHLYFDGGTERKLQIKDLNKSLCKLHATWSFDSASLG